MPNSPEPKFHCQICERSIKAGNGNIAHHGYTRPDRGSGWQTASCIGAKHLPYEKSCDMIPVAIASINAYIKSKKAQLKSLVYGVPIPNPDHADWMRAKIERHAYSSRRWINAPEPEKTIVPMQVPLVRTDGTTAINADGSVWMVEKNYGYGRTYKSVLESLQRSIASDISASTETKARFEVRLAEWKLVD